MAYSLRSGLVAAALAWVVASGPAEHARAGVLLYDAGTPDAAQPGTERPVEGTLPAPTPLYEQSPAYVLPPAGWPAIDFRCPDPLLDRPDSAQPGFFSNVQTDVLLLHLHNRLRGPVPNALTGAVDQVQLGRTDLDPTAAARIEIGYRLPDNWGTCSFGYSFLASQGHEQSVTGPDDVIQAPADKVGRLVYNLWDLTYGSREYCPDACYTLSWGAGARMMSLYFDTRGQFLNPGGGPGSVLAQLETNYVQCYGFWIYLDVERHLGAPGLSAFCRLEASDFFGRVHQNYAETVVGSPAQSPETFGDRFTFLVSPSILREVVGLSYAVPRWNYSRLLLGYQYEQFFQIGRLSLTDGFVDTRGSLDAHGLFLRAEFNF
jgi:hypothetical protein